MTFKIPKKHKSIDKINMNLYKAKSVEQYIILALVEGKFIQILSIKKDKYVQQKARNNVIENTNFHI